MFRDWLKNRVGFNVVQPLLVIGLSYQLIRLIREEKWLFIGISVICILGLLIQMIMGYRAKMKMKSEQGILKKRGTGKPVPLLVAGAEPSP